MTSIAPGTLPTSIENKECHSDCNIGSVAFLVQLILLGVYQPSLK